jgi:hypothetical protein
MHSALTMMNKHLLATILLAACTSTAPGARPHDMSAAQHEREANREADAADRDASKYDPNARDVIQGCGPYDAVCWRSKRNPTAEFRTKAEDHRRAAAEHRAASAALREAEAKACVGVDADDRDISPFERSEDIARVEPLTEACPSPIRGARAGAVKRPVGSGAALRVAAGAPRPARSSTSRYDFACASICSIIAATCARMASLARP